MGYADQDILEVLQTQEALKDRVAQLGAQITHDYAGKTPVIISVLRGSYIFMADLTRSIDLPCTVDFMSVSSYGAGTSSSGQVKIIKDLRVLPESRMSSTMRRSRPSVDSLRSLMIFTWPEEEVPPP